MGYRRRASGGNPDGNQKDLIKLARRLGASVAIVSQVNGFTDAVVGFRGSNGLAEFKMPGFKKKQARGRKITQTEQDQAALRATWAGRPPEIIETYEDLLKFLLAMDLNRPTDYQDVADDYLGAVIRALRSGTLDVLKDF